MIRPHVLGCTSGYKSEFVEPLPRSEAHRLTWRLGLKRVGSGAFWGWPLVDPRVPIVSSWENAQRLYLSATEPFEYATFSHGDAPIRGEGNERTVLRHLQPSRVSGKSRERVCHPTGLRRVFQRVDEAIVERQVRKTSHSD